MHSQIIDTLVERGKWKDALAMFQEQRKNDENFQLDCLKLNRLAFLLVQNDRIQGTHNCIFSIS